jgi:hypothetical protein
MGVEVGFFAVVFADVGDLDLVDMVADSATEFIGGKTICTAL